MIFDTQNKEPVNLIINRQMHYIKFHTKTLKITILSVLMWNLM